MLSQPPHAFPSRRLVSQSIVPVAQSTQTARIVCAVCTALPPPDNTGLQSHRQRNEILSHTPSLCVDSQLTAPAGHTTKRHFCLVFPV